MMYADNVKLCLPLTNPNFHELFQADLNNLHSWCIQNFIFIGRIFSSLDILSSDLERIFGIIVTKAKGVFAFVKR